MPTVLIADSDEDTRRILATILKYENFDVLEAESAEVAERLAETHAIDVMVVNYPMKLAGELTLTRALTQSGSTRDLPVINFTSRVSPELTAAAEADGATCTVAKPAHLSVILEAIRRVIG